MKSKLMTCLTILILIAAVAGIFCYMGYVRQNGRKEKGTLIWCMPCMTEEYSL